MTYFEQESHLLNLMALKSVRNCANYINMCQETDISHVQYSFTP